MDLELYKRKTQMVLYALEQGLGKYVINKNCVENISNQLIQLIEDREEHSGRTFNPENIKSIVAAAHFSEIFDLAAQSTAHTSDQELLEKLRLLTKEYELPTIRNAVSHPNRDFYLNYWFQTASVASCHIIESLKLDDIKKSVISAENGNLVDPPEAWLIATSFKIQNNLPHTFEHGATGLVGRNQEIKKLKKLINNKRISTIAIVAPGGVGKTALVLDLLNKLSVSPEMAAQYKGIIFVSLKKEQLTTDGIKILSAVESIDELKNVLVEEFNDIFGEEYSDFDELITSTQDHMPLLFIDNLETLIRDDESLFNDFNLSLPEDWKVLVTSRLNISNATTLPLETLKKEPAAQLTREYIKNKGGENLSENVIYELVSECGFNPLAIKLSIDYWNLGNELPTSYKKANTSIAEYSFKNLIDTISEYSIQVLELLFTIEKCSRKEVCNLLEISIDKSASAISELSKTSLIKRITDNSVEYYEINSSVRDFLLVNPKNIEIRLIVQKRIRKNKDRAIEIIKYQQRRNVSIFDEAYIPETASQDLKIALNKVNKIINQNRRSGVSISELYLELSELKSIFDTDYLYHRAMARIYNSMLDRVSELQHINIARELNKADVATSIMQAKFFHDEREYDKAEGIYRELIDSDNAKEIKKHRKIWLSILNGFYLSLLQQSKYSDVLEETKKWNKDKEYGDTIGTYRASAYKRKIDIQIESNDLTVSDSINSCLKIFDTVFKESGYFHVACREGYKVIDTLSKFLLKIHLGDDKVSQFLEFSSRHITEIYEVLGKERSELSLTIELLKKINVVKNPFNNNKWKLYLSPCSEIGVSIDELDGEKYETLSVQHIPQNGKYRENFLFAEDAYHQRYFVHKTTIRNGSVQHFFRLNVGDKLAITHKQIEGKDYPDAIDTYFIKG